MASPSNPTVITKGGSYSFFDQISGEQREAFLERTLNNSYFRIIALEILRTNRALPLYKMASFYTREIAQISPSEDPQGVKVIHLYHYCLAHEKISSMMDRSNLAIFCPKNVRGESSSNLVLQGWKVPIVDESSLTIGKEGPLYLANKSEIFSIHPVSGKINSVIASDPTSDEIEAAYQMKFLTQGKNGLLYVFTVDSIWTNCRENSGKLQVFSPAGTLIRTLPLNFVRMVSPPTLGWNGVLYFGTLDGYLSALSSDGTPQWTIQMKPLYGSPVIDHDGTIYVVDFHNTLYAVNRDSTIKWIYQTPFNTGSTSPAIGPDGTIYLCCGQKDTGRLHAIDSNGSFKWSYTTRTRCASPSVGIDGTIYISGYDDRLLAINPDGTEKWTFTMGYQFTSVVSIGVNGTLLVSGIELNSKGEDSGYFLCAIKSNGTLKWTFPTETEITDFPSVGLNGTIYILTENALQAIHEID